MWKREDWAPQFDRDESHRYPWWQDARHVAFQYQLVMACRQHFRRVLEIGCYKGASTSAYVQAMIEGAAFELTCCDVQIRPELRAVAARSPRPVTLLEQDSLFAIKPEFDLVILDADHTAEAVSRELGLLLAFETPTIILHDTCAGHIEACEGPSWARDCLERLYLYECVTDAKPRPGEFTDRGLTVATRFHQVYQTAKNLMGAL